ncbi:hypothetical protein SNEBB_010699 [Seison nebaliae]|nr:hypothetical protein SNEBB_010699 [Seison nebaliae]
MSSLISMNSGAAVTGKGAHMLERIDGKTIDFYDMIAINKTEAIVTISNDRSLRIWQKRDNGSFWPSVCEFLPSIGLSLFYSRATSLLLVGCNNGQIIKFKIPTDLNSVEEISSFYCHSESITSIIFLADIDECLSIGGKDRMFIWSDVNAESKCCTHILDSTPQCLRHDNDTQYVFIGEDNGSITILRLISQTRTVSVVSKLAAHESSVRTLFWEPVKQWLISGGADNVVICWDVGGQKGKSVQLHGHGSEIRYVLMHLKTQLLLSISADGVVGIWDMYARREEIVEWKKSDICEQCGRPFFWNIRQMWSDRCIGIRQHHCRRCGAAVCDTCSSHRSTLPAMGYEISVRVCKNCHECHIKDKDRLPRATFHSLKNGVIKGRIAITSKLLYTINNDCCIRVWNIADMLVPDANLRALANTL